MKLTCSRVMYYNLQCNFSTLEMNYDIRLIMYNIIICNYEQEIEWAHNVQYYHTTNND